MVISRKTWNNVDEKAAVKELYHSAFPKEERLPWWLLRLISLRRQMGITAYYADEVFCGMTVSVGTEDTLFLLFFAVAEDLRGKGCGSAILELLQQENPRQAIVLNVEIPDEQAENVAQRIRRLRFYNRNGFFDTGFNIDEVGGTFRVLSNRALDVPAYQRVFARLSYGCWKPYIRPIEEDAK